MEATGTLWAIDTATGHRIELSSILESYQINAAAGEMMKIELRCRFGGYVKTVVKEERPPEDRAIDL
jgi:hypothetical protein